MRFINASKWYILLFEPVGKHEREGKNEGRNVLVGWMGQVSGRILPILVKWAT